ncbi:piezo-type mechanosensitive ion channel component 2-like, partial [Lampris incognitus]|uniref:piezo-type mechanosensitive ion channel component 2-like n=1 Tax=Lampris incognitus TaxID=2546036 RepID=UPI0024B58C40
GLLFRLLLPVSLTAGNPGRVLKAVCITSLAFLLLQICFQVTFSSLQATGNLQPGYNCSAWEKTLRQLGLQSLSGADAGSVVRLVLPDVGMLAVGLLTWTLCVRMEPTTTTQQHEAEEERIEEEENTVRCEEQHMEEEEAGGRSQQLVSLLTSLVYKTREIISNVITTGGKVLVTCLLGLTGIMLPSLSSLLYLLCFQGLCTWWAVHGRVPPLLFSCTVLPLGG